MFHARTCILCLLILFAPRLAKAGCTPIAINAPRVIPADAAPDTLTITFLGHASFLIETPDGVRAVTDYNGSNVLRDPPDIATMNHAHSTHYTDYPDPRIRYVLHGWRDDGTPAQIDLTVRDLHVANLPTNIRDGQGGTEVYGNSIFLFESAGLCIAHLSHLHHLLTDQDLVLLGHIDVVMAPVDGVFTMSQPDMARCSISCIRGWSCRCTITRARLSRVSSIWCATAMRFGSVIRRRCCCRAQPCRNDRRSTYCQAAFDRHARRPAATSPSQCGYWVNEPASLHTRGRSLQVRPKAARTTSPGRYGSPCPSALWL